MPLARRTFLQALAALLVARPGLAAAAPAAQGAPFMALAIAGIPYHRYAEVAATLAAGDRLRLAREPGNLHDANAVAILTEEGAKLGYVPARAAAEVAARLDRGEAVEAAISSFLPRSAPGERFAIPEGLVRTWCEPGEPVVALRA